MNVKFIAMACAIVAFGLTLMFLIISTLDYHISSKTLGGQYVEVKSVQNSNDVLHPYLLEVSVPDGTKTKVFKVYSKYTHKPGAGKVWMRLHVKQIVFDDIITEYKLPSNT